ncbi:GNAT family N-acetyltransferase [Streptococcus gallolyticus]|uniref:GNAT family N-acetyltransferase n=1 Tax=Streptococcus gallolyticus TaxID=315405 RepID=UPI0020982716|nr:GNAT family N-acetyltransferase [Streptococcus gallolyticus]MCO7178905.1 GNAT family N-acetyltransferase [Streptococcus gallolyticus]
MLETLEIEAIKEILSSFKSINEDEPHDVETFLHKKAIDFEKTALASTYLVFDTETNILLGFFSLANKPLTMSKKNFESLSKNQQKKLRRSGRTIGTKFQVNSYLIGQLGKNYSEEAQVVAETYISGKELLTLAYDQVVAASRVIKARYVWIECEDVEYLKNFYQNFGFRLIPDYESSNNLKVMLMKIQR